MRLVMDRRRSPVWIPACAGMTGEGWLSPFVILGLTQDPGLRASRCLALDPDFRQDDGGVGGTFARFVGGGGVRECLPAPSSPRRRGSIGYAVGDGSPAVASLDPRLRGDDGGGGGPPLRHPGLDPGPRVGGGGAAWLWVPTFVGMTERGEDGTEDDETGDDGKRDGGDWGEDGAGGGPLPPTRVRRC